MDFDNRTAIEENELAGLRVEVHNLQEGYQNLRQKHSMNIDPEAKPRANKLIYSGKPRTIFV
jgi:hypothetical protein